MQPESQIPNTPATRYFLSAIIAKRNVLDMGIHLYNYGEVLGKPKERFQFVATGVVVNGYSEGWILNLN